MYRGETQATRIRAFTAMFLYGCLRNRIMEQPEAAPTEKRACATYRAFVNGVYRCKERERERERERAIVHVRVLRYASVSPASYR